MPPKTLTAEQVAEIDRKQQKPVNWSAVIPQREDVLTYRVNRAAARQDAPAMLTAEQTDAAEAQSSVAAETSFGRAMGARPDRSVGPQVPAPKKVLSAAEVDQADYERVGNIAYIPTKNEWKRYGELRQRRDDKVGKFIEAGQAIAGGLVQAAAATAYAPFDFVTRGTKAYDEWVNSSAEGLRQASISTAELYSWAGDMVNDGVQETERVNVIDNQLRQRLAAENKFTGNAQADAQIFAQAREQAMASGAYEKTQEQEASDEDTQYQRFIRDRSLQQQAANITETNIGTLPDGRAEMGIDESKLNQGLVLASALVLDPLNIAVPAGLGAANKVRLLRRVGSLAGKPLKLGSKVAGGAAQKAENLYSGIVEGVESATGIGEAGQAAALSAVSWKAAAAMATLKGSGKLLRRAERGLETGSIIAREIGIGGAGVSRVEAASKLRSAPIPERYRRAYDGFFTSADSTLRRVSETQGLSPIARRSAATLDKLGATQAFRLADDAVSGAAATAPIAVPLAAIAPEERRPEILGSIMTIGAGAGLIGGKLARSAEFEDALVAKMLADADISGGDATSMANMMPHDRLVNMARMQSVISPKADFIPLRAADYEINTTVKEAMGLGTRGIYVDAKKGQRPRIFVNLDKMATGDVAGHEIGHAILKSDILGGEVKRGMRAMVDQQYGTDGVAARGREYVTANLTQEVRDGTTGIQLNVLRPDEVTRIAAAGGDEAAEQALKNEFIRERWANDTDWRKQAIEERADMLNQERLAQGEISWDWARDEIAAETFSGLGKGLNLSGIRASGPLSRAVGAASAGFEAMGARMRGNGRLETPNRLFVENPLFDTPEMRKAVNNYVKTFDRYLVGLEKEGAVKQRGTPIAPTGKAQDAARSPHTRTYSNRDGTVIESDLFIERPDGTRVPKSQQQLDTQERVRAATIKSINDRTKFVNENSDEWGARKFSNGRVEVGGPNLPLQFDHFIQVPEWLRSKAREFEAGRSKGRSYLYSYNAIGTGEVGSYKIKNLGNVEAKTGEMVPFGWAVSTKNHLLAKVIDLNSFRAAAIRAIDNEQLGEFGNDLRAVESGLKQLLSNYENGVAGETGLGVTRKNILNGLLGTGTVVQRASNPVWHTLNNQGSVRTFRFDRLNYADPHGTGYFPHYNKININALPDDAGRMSLDQYGQFDADRKAAWMNKEAVKRGFSNATNWQNADAQGFQAADGQYRQQFPAGGAAQRGSAMPDAATTSKAAKTLEDLKRTSFIPTKVASDVLGGFPEYLKPVAQFIADQRGKLVEGKMNMRDITKAYVMTIASQGSGARAVEVIASNLAKKDIPFAPTQDFLTTDKQGRAAIRPEEAAAYWLGTEAGQRALNNAESGVFNPSDWQEMVALRKAYGDDRFATVRAFSPENIARIPQVLSDINASRGNTDAVLTAVQKLNGISTGKKGFISHLLGIGDVPTIDAVEINFWLTGKGDVGKLNTKRADLVRRVKESVSDRRVSEELFRRIDNRINGLRDQVQGGAEVAPEVWSHVMHHWLWDKAKKIETTHEGMYRAQASFLPDTVISDEGGTVWRTLQEAPVITLKDLRGRKVFASFADLTSAGKLYKGIDSSEVAIPVRTHGGPEWPLLQAERVGEETNVWSNQGAGVSTTKAKRADEGAIMLVAAMHKNAHVSNTETSTAVIATNAAYARDGRIAGDNLQRLDDMIRAEMPDFVGIESPDVMAYVNKLPFQGERSRSRIAQILGSKEAEALGAPNLQRILDEMRSSEFDGLRIGDAVMAIELTAGAPVLKLGENGTLKHPSYQYAVRGRVLGRFARPINVETIFDDFYAQRRAQGKPQQGDRRALDLAKPVQVINDAIADRIPSNAYTAIKSPRHAQLINMAVNDQWRSTSASVKQGGVSPADIVSALNASPAKVALSRYDLKTLSGKVRAKELEVFQLGDSGVYFGVRKGDPASDYGLAPDAYGFGPDERTLTLVMNNERKAGGMADAIVVKALQNGVTALDCFAVKSGRSPSGFLPELYERFGFQRVGEIPFDPSFYSKTELADLRKYWKSTGWDESVGMPSIVLMKWKGTNEQRPKSLRELVGQSSSGVRQGDKRGSLFRDAEGSSGRLPRRRGGSQRRTGQGDAGAGQGVQGSDAGVRLGRGILGPVEELIGLSPAELRNLGIQ